MYILGSLFKNYIGTALHYLTVLFYPIRLRVYFNCAINFLNMTTATRATTQVLKCLTFYYKCFTIGASDCYRCPEGHYCTSGSTADICPAGYYCPEGTGYDIQPCPVGTFGERPGLVTNGQCTKCTAGHYCQFSGKSNVTGPCDGG